MPNNTIKKVLIANRGEIALRVQQTCQKLGLECAITVSDADKGSTFSKLAKEIAPISGQAARDTYLSIDKLIEAAKRHKCDAVHPGYGFLSEQPAFAEAVVHAGMTFIGPTAASMRALGDKLSAKELAIKNKVPCLQAVPDNQSEETLLKNLKGLKFPLLIKAAAGGGGRGMRIVRTKEELMPSLELARSEAQKFFSDGRVYLERFLEKPRHVEVQILGDSHGNVVHFGTRDCSAQRRHQKLVEEAPAPNIPAKVREKIHAAACKLARAVSYNSVGTAEFLYQDQEFFFLEMNTRIQVEHPVTEIIVGLDLIEQQINVAEGNEIPFRQNQVKFKGHAIEYRIYAEDSKNNFMPAMGTIGEIKRPKASFLREDFGLSTGDRVTPFYDAMLGKIIIKADSRKQALDRSKKILKDYKIEGLPTTLDFHRWILNRKEFLKNPVDIGFIEREFIVHETKFETMDLPDGSFIAVPLSKEGVRAKEKFCRRASSKELAIQAVRDEVLLNSKLQKIFSK